MPAEVLQSSRFELKYVIPESCARAIRDFGRSYLVPDRFAVNLPNHEYDVCSLYLDSPDMVLCRATQQGMRNRFKLRIRYYDERPQSPAWFEIKSRQDGIILKQRTPVKKGSVRRLLHRHQPSPLDMLKPDGRAFGSLQRFCGLSKTIGANACVFVSYRREAYVAPDNNSLRVTFDRHIKGARYRNEPCPTNRNGWVKAAVPGVVLEIKFTNRFPDWLAELVRAFDLERCSVAKYVMCSEELLRPVMPAWPEVPLGWSQCKEIRQ